MLLTLPKSRQCVSFGFISLPEESAVPAARCAGGLNRVGCENIAWVAVLGASSATTSIPLVTPGAVRFKPQVSIRLSVRVVGGGSAADVCEVQREASPRRTEAG